MLGWMLRLIIIGILLMVVLLSGGIGWLVRLCKGI